MNVSVSLNLNTHIIILEFNMTAAIYTWIITFHVAYSFICFFNELNVDDVKDPEIFVLKAQDVLQKLLFLHICNFWCWLKKQLLRLKNTVFVKNKISV